MASSTIPNKKTLTGGGVGQNVAPTNSNPALSGAGSFCQLATGISAPIAETIQSTIASLNSLQGTIDGIVYAPAVGLNELQRKIASGELLNNVTLKIQLAVGQILKNAATSLATSAVTSAVTTLANDALKGASNAITSIKSPLGNITNKIGDAAGGVSRQLDQAAGQLAAGVYSIAKVPGNLITQAGVNIGGYTALGGTLITTGIEANKILRDTLLSTTSIVSGVSRIGVSTITSTASQFAVQKQNTTTQPK